MTSDPIGSDLQVKIWSTLPLLMCGVVEEIFQTERWLATTDLRSGCYTLSFFSALAMGAERLYYYLPYSKCDASTSDICRPSDVRLNT
eukprot:IDg20406t1